MVERRVGECRELGAGRGELVGLERGGSGEQGGVDTIQNHGHFHSPHRCGE